MSPRTTSRAANAQPAVPEEGQEDPVLDADPYWLMVSSAPVPLLEMDLSGRVVRWNPAFLAMAGPPAEEDPGHTFEGLIGSEAWEELREVVTATGQARAFECTLTRGDGANLPVEVAATAVHLPSQDVRIIGSIRDLTAQRATEERLRQEAQRDALTGLPHRGALIESLEHHLARLRRDPERRFAVGFLDLNDFKAINDAAGHLVGDRVLMAVAQRLRNGLRPDDRIFRYGGDEFVLLFGDVDGQGAAAAVGRRVLHLLARQFRIGDEVLDVGASLGICLCEDAGMEPEELIRRADVAMTMAKRGSTDGEAQIVAC